MLAADGGLKVLDDMGQPPFIPCRVASQTVKEVLAGNLPERVVVRD
jgi:molybdate/tungstate transport system substrate-binding protein